MRYLSSNIDGSVAVITLCPIAILRHADGATITVQGLRRTGPQGIVPGQCVLYGSVGINGEARPAQMVIGTDAYDIADLEADSVPGYTFVFPDVQRDVIGKWVPAARDAVTSVRVCNKHELLADRTFRDAWRDAGDRIAVNLPAAREIHRVRIRAARVPKLAALDVAYQRADERGDQVDQRRIAAEKQALRDLPADPAIDAATTPDDLKAFWPAILT